VTGVQTCALPILIAVDFKGVQFPRSLHKLILSSNKIVAPCLSSPRFLKYLDLSKNLYFVVFLLGFLMSILGLRRFLSHCFL